VFETGSIKFRHMGQKCIGSNGQYAVRNWLLSAKSSQWEWTCSARFE
jgi:hypothetical protein